MGMGFSRLLLTLALVLAAARGGTASTLLEEGFDDVAALSASGWVMVNQSHPIGSTGWFQGRGLIFPAQAGSPDSYIAANFLNAVEPGTIDNWLLSPPLMLTNGDEISFHTRQDTSSFADALEVRLSQNGASTNVGGAGTSGDFTTLLASYNPGLAPGGYPQDWTAVALPIAGLSEPTLCRIALRYRVVGNATSGDFIAFDSFEVESVPEPDRLTALALGGPFLLGLARRRSRVAS